MNICCCCCCCLEWCSPSCETVWKACPIKPRGGHPAAVPGWWVTPPGCVMELAYFIRPISLPPFLSLSHLHRHVAQCQAFIMQITVNLSGLIDILLLHLELTSSLGPGDNLLNLPTPLPPTPAISSLYDFFSLFFYWDSWHSAGILWKFLCAPFKLPLRLLMAALEREHPSVLVICRAHNPAR